MLFNTVLFAVYFLVFFIAFKFVARTPAQKMWFILIGSCIFYAAWDYRFVPLLLGTALIDFFIARAMERAPRGSRVRVRLLAGSIVANLGVLAFFKYTNFFMSASYDLKNALFSTKDVAPILPIVLPVGISFYTFQSMSYTIDVFRGELKARSHPRDFLAAVSFFPHLVAGPIIRATTLLPQFERAALMTWATARIGFIHVAVGLFNKSIADLLAGPAHDAFANIAHGDALQSWTGVLAFGGQIYGDFSGYSEIAIGVALLLGFTLPKNFNLPYIASSPSDFWRRWHISLSTWLRDYLYIPLGSNARRYRNLFLTMLLGGLWHGANWTFIAWGGYHGFLLVGQQWGTARLRGRASRLLDWIRRPATFYLVTISWVLFRATTITDAARMLRNMHWPTAPSVFDHNSVTMLALVIGAIVLCHLVSYAGEWASSASRAAKIAFWPLAFALLTLSILFGGDGRSFIYFQF